MCTLNTYVIRKKLSYCFVLLVSISPPENCDRGSNVINGQGQNEAYQDGRKHSAIGLVFSPVAFQSIYRGSTSLGGGCQMIPTGQFSNASRAGRRDRWCLFLSAPNTYGFNEEICLCAAAIRSFWVGNVILFYFTSNAKWQIHGRTTRPSVPS